MSTPVPDELHVQVHEMTAEAWACEVHTRSHKTEPVMASTLPSIPKEDLGRLQRCDSLIGPLWTFKEKGYTPTKRQLMKFDKKARKLFKYWNKVEDQGGVLVKLYFDN